MLRIAGADEDNLPFIPVNTCVPDCWTAAGDARANPTSHDRFAIKNIDHSSEGGTRRKYPVLPMRVSSWLKRARIRSRRTCSSCLCPRTWRTKSGVGTDRPSIASLSDLRSTIPLGPVQRTEVDCFDRKHGHARQSASPGQSIERVVFPRPCGQTAF